MITTLTDAPEIHQSLSPGPVLLGHPIPWTIEITHKLWKSYTLAVQPCSGLEIQVLDNTIAREQGQIHSVFHLVITPQELNLPEAPTLILTDEAGHKTTVTGKALSVRSISGTSLEIKDPITPQFSSADHFGIAIVIAVVLVISALAIAFIKLYRARSPRALFLRDLKRAQSETRRQRSISAEGIIPLLRSPFVWGIDANSQTTVELLQFAQSDQRLVSVAQGLMVLEQSKYSGSKVLSDRNLAHRSLAAALDMAKVKEK